ncbi:hypothetical protein [Anaerosinus massiliensis]|uniref:hypothetical protein n=1 Tax=Massilibacillus massiliensis TaxID=1806837 RepID=UPI000DA5EFC5|nr:hypothetical protein [Massilibacillus massiliensis]
MQRPDIEKLKDTSIDEIGRIGAEQHIKELIEYIERLEEEQRILLANFRTLSKNHQKLINQCVGRKQHA